MNHRHFAKQKKGGSFKSMGKYVKMTFSKIASPSPASTLNKLSAYTLNLMKVDSERYNEPKRI